MMQHTLQRLSAVLTVGCAFASCGDAQQEVPEILVGTWQEGGYERAIVLGGDGQFRNVTTMSGSIGSEIGAGDWSATDTELTFELESGQFRWQESTNNAPIVFVFEYQVTEERLSLTFEIVDDISTTEYVRVY